MLAEVERVLGSVSHASERHWEAGCRSSCTAASWSRRSCIEDLCLRFGGTKSSVRPERSPSLPPPQPYPALEMRWKVRLSVFYGASKLKPLPGIFGQAWFHSSMHPNKQQRPSRSGSPEVSVRMLGAARGRGRDKHQLRSPFPINPKPSPSCGGLAMWAGTRLCSPLATTRPSRGGNAYQSMQAKIGRLLALRSKTHCFPRLSQLGVEEGCGLRDV